MLNTAELIAATNSLEAELWPAVTGAKDSATRNRLRTELTFATNALEAEWAEWLAYNYGVEHPEVAAMIYSRAWQDGHSSGYGEVESIYEDLSIIVLRAIGLSVL
jgi:hypothetical protein